MSIDGNAWTQSNYFYFRIDRPNFIKIDDPAVTSPCDNAILFPDNV